MHSSVFFCLPRRNRPSSSEFYKITKRYLVRVCKAWYSLASPFLFEYIYLGRGRVLASLLDGMLRSERAVELQELPHAIGWRTQRLDVHMRDRTDNPALIMGILVDILRRLPNLRVLTFAIVGHGYNALHFPDSVLQATNACRDTLRLLNWYGGLKPFPKAWESFLENHPQLEAINAPVILNHLKNSHIVLDSLKSVYVHCPLESDHAILGIGNELWDVHFPNIHHAIYDITSASYRYYDIFLKKIGPQLTSIQINCLKSFDSSHFVEVAFYAVFSIVTATCPNLTRVDLVIYEWKILPPLVFPENVHTLGIRVNVSQIPRRCVVTLFGNIHNFLLRFPFVKTISFIDQLNVRVLRSHRRALISNVAQILTLGVNVMDHEGHSLVA